MMLKSRVVIVLFLLLGIGGTSGVPQKDSESSSPEGANDSINQLLAVIRSVNKSALVEYHGTCIAPDSDITWLPLKAKANNISENSTALSTIQKIFQDNKQISVTQLDPELVLIKSKDVWPNLLHIKIGKVKFNPEAQFNPELAVGAILESGHVRAAAHGLNAKPVLSSEGLFELPSLGRPHLSESIGNITIESALRIMLRTFRGLAVYRECATLGGGHNFEIDFFR